jgi:hypothetical protein
MSPPGTPPEDRESAPLRDAERVRRLHAGRRRRLVPRFHPGGEFTVGVEEELMLLQHDGAPDHPAVGGELAGFLRTPTAAFQVHVGVPDPLRELAHELVQEAGDALRGLGPGREEPLLGLLGALSGADECRRQRRVRMEHGMGRLVADLARRTGSPLPSPVVACSRAGAGVG